MQKICIIICIICIIPLYHRYNSSHLQEIQKTPQCMRKRLRLSFPISREEAYLLPLSSQKFLVLILSPLEGWKAASILEPTSGFEHGAPGLGILHVNHQVIAPYFKSFFSVQPPTQIFKTLAEKILKFS